MDTNTLYLCITESIVSLKYCPYINGYGIKEANMEDYTRLNLNRTTAVYANF